MKTNPLRAGVERGELQIGTWVNMVRNPAILPLLKAAGLDFARFDMEHSGPSIETIANMALLARALDFPIAVRMPRANREWITRLLDLGVYTLHCPQVESAKHAEEIVAATRYAPRGQRGWAGMSPAWDYEKTIPPQEKKEFANREVFVTVMFETAEAFKDLDDIAAMDGIDALTIGPADLSRMSASPERRTRQRCWTRSDPGPRSCEKARQDLRHARLKRRAGPAMEGSRGADPRLCERGRRAARRIQAGDGADQGRRISADVNEEAVREHPPSRRRPGCVRKIGTLQKLSLQPINSVPCSLRLRHSSHGRRAIRNEGNLLMINPSHSAPRSRASALVGIAALIMLITVSACAQTPPPPPPPPEPFASEAPPPPPREMRPPLPHPKAIWVAGHYRWVFRRYLWIPGHWAFPPENRPWVPGHWARHRLGWFWVPGYWQ